MVSQNGKCKVDKRLHFWMKDCMNEIFKAHNCGVEFEDYKHGAIAFKITGERQDVFAATAEMFRFDKKTNELLKILEGLV